MEKSRAIELLKLAVPIKALTQQEYADFVEAVNMGMDALEQPTSPNTIDRKAALDALRRCQTYLYDARDPELKIELSSAEAAINNLSTIQPEKAQLSKEGTTSDLISRQAVINAIENTNAKMSMPEWDEITNAVMSLPTIQPVATDTNDGDTISRQAVLDAIVQCTNCGDEDTLREYVLKHSLDNGWTGGILEALDAVKELPTVQPEPQWIPVSERLPEESEYCIITANDGVGRRTTFAKFQKKAKSWDLTGARSYWRVIAWMPLPEAYKSNKK